MGQLQDQVEELIRQLEFVERIFEINERLRILIEAIL